MNLDYLDHGEQRPWLHRLGLQLHRCHCLRLRPMTIYFLELQIRHRCPKVYHNNWKEANHQWSKTIKTKTMNNSVQEGNKRNESQHERRKVKCTVSGGHLLRTATSGLLFRMKSFDAGGVMSQRLKMICRIFLAAPVPWSHHGGQVAHVVHYTFISIEQFPNMIPS